MSVTFTAYVEYDAETKFYVGTIPGIPGAHTQGATLDELHENLKEVLSLCLEKNPGFLDERAKFVGTQQVEVLLLAVCPSSISKRWTGFYDG